MKGDVHSDLATLAFNNGEQLEDFHIIILILLQELNLSGSIVSPTRLLFQYTKALSNSDKLKEFVVPKMTDLVTFLVSKGKSAVYIGGNIHVIYRYLEMVGVPTTLTTSGRCSHHFGSSASIKNDTTSLQPFISDIYMRQKIICECCGRIGHKDDACIIRGPKIPPTKS